MSSRTPAQLRGLRAGVVAGAVGACASVLSAMAPSYLVYLLCFGVGFGAASGVIYTSSLEIAAEASTPGRAAPAMVALFGLGGALFGAVMRMFVDAGYGLWSIAPIPVSLLFACGVGLLVLRLSSWQGSREKVSSDRSAERSVTSGTVAMLWVLFALGASAGLICLGLALTILGDEAPDARLAAMAIFVIALANTAGRLSVAILSRRVLPYLIVALGRGICTFALAGPLLLHGAVIVLVCLVLLAAGYGLVASGMPNLTCALLQAGEFGLVFPIVLTGWGAAGFLALQLPGQVHDATGSFEPVLLGCLFVSALAAALALAFGRRSPSRACRA